MIKIKPIKNDTTTIDKDEFFVNNLYEEDYSDPEFEELQKNVSMSINSILDSDNIANLKEDFIFLNDYIEYKDDYVFPSNFVQKVLFFVKEKREAPDIQVVLRLIKFITSYDSIMQQFLLDNGIFDILLPYFPNEEVIDTFSNLACAKAEAKIYLLEISIVDFIIENINDLEHFDWLVILARNILYRNGDFSYEPYVEQFIKLFHIIFSKVNSIENDSVEIVISAARDYIEADDNFFNDFIENNYLLLFTKITINTYEFIRPLLKISEIIIDKKREDGAQCLIHSKILELIFTKFIYNENQEIRNFCFALLYILINHNPSIADDSIVQDCHTIALSEFNGDSTFQYKISIFKFCCVLIRFASFQNIIELIKEGIVDMLIEDPTVLQRESDWIILIEAVCRLKNFEDNEIVHNQFISMKNSEDFYNWIQELSASEDCEMAGFARAINDEFSAVNDDDSN